MTLEFRALKAGSVEAKLLVLQTTKTHYALAIGYHPYRLANRSPRYVNTVSGYAAKLVMKAMWHMKAHVFNSKNPISIISSIAKFYLACDTNKIYEGAAMWVLPHFVEETSANALNSRICATGRTVPLTATIRQNKV